MIILNEDVINSKIPESLPNSDICSSKLDESFSSFNSTNEERKNHEQLQILLLDPKESQLMPSDDGLIHTNTEIRKYIKFNKALSRFDINNHVINLILGTDSSNEDRKQFTKFIKDFNNYFLETDYLNILKRNKKSKILKIGTFVILVCFFISLVTFGIIKFKSLTILTGIIFFLIAVLLIFGCFFLFRKIQQHKFVEEYSLFSYNGKNNYRMKKYVGEWNESFFIQKKIKATIPLHLDYIMFTYEINEQV